MTAVHALLAAWLVLYAGVRSTRMAGCFNVDNPDLPEISHERTQMALARVGSPDSVPLALPCMGMWTVSQGFGGQYTHRGPWRHALDFIVAREGTSFTQQGRRMEDFYCYNLPVLSPAYGQVWRVVNDVPDNAPWQRQFAGQLGQPRRHPPGQRQVRAAGPSQTGVHLLPMATARWCAALLWPWAAFARSTCERVWDAEQQAWKQQTRHRQQLTGISCTTVALLTPQLGCSHIHAEVGEDRYTLQATHSFQRSDLGVPAWEVPVRLASLPG